MAMRFIVYAAVLGLFVNNTSPAVANDETVIQQVSGNGTRSLRPFSVEGQWELRWDLKGQSIEVYLKQSDGEPVGLTPMASQKKPGAGSTFYPKSGSFYLRILSDGDWTVTVVQLGTVADAPQLAPSASPSPKASTPRNLTLREVAWSRSRYGALFANFLIENVGDGDVRDFTIACVAYGPSGTAIDSVSKTIYEILKAKTTKEYEGVEIGPIHSQVAAVRCLATESSAGVHR